MEYIAIQKNISSSPRKLRLMADMVRKMNPAQALDTLQFAQQAAAVPLSKAIKTALGNAKGAEGLVFKKLEINEGMKMKRYRVGTAGRGRGRPYKKRLSHIKIVLTDEVVSLEKALKQVRPSAKDQEYIVEEPKKESKQATGNSEQEKQSQEKEPKRVRKDKK